MKPSVHDPRFPSGLVTIVIPAKNEEAAIGATLRALPRDTIAAMGLSVEVLVLDGKSRDATRDVVYEYGDATVVFDRERGKGRAFINGRPHMRGDYVVMLDADGTYPPDAIPAVLNRLMRGADVVMGERDPLPGAMSLLHHVGNVMLSLLAQTLYLRRCPDVCTGLWGFRGESLKRLPLRSTGFELEAELFAVSARKGLRMDRVRVDYLPRLGTSKLTTLDALRIGWWLLFTRVAALDEVDAFAHAPHAGPAGRGAGAVQ